MGRGEDHAFLVYILILEVVETEEKKTERVFPGRQETVSG